MTQTLFYPDWRATVVFSPAGPQPVTLIENEKVKTLVAGLEAGQMIPPHPAELGVYNFLEGNGWMTVEGVRLRVSAGATVIVPQGATRGIEAESRLAFLATRVA
jgi:quercetin dioxygenase-like cupin family protein